MAGIATKAASTWNVQIVVGNRGHVACRCRSTSAAEVRVPTRRRHLDRGDGIVARAPKPSSASSLSLISMASPREDRKSDRDGGGGFGRGWRVTSQRHRYPPVTGARIGCGDKCAAIDRDGRSLQGGGVGVGGGGGGRGGGGRRAGAGAGGLHVRWHFLAGGCRGRGRGDSCCSGALPRGTPVAITGHVASPRCLNHQPDEGSSPCNDKRFDSASRLVGDIQGRAEEVHSTVERQREVEGVSLQEKDRRPTAVPDTWCRSRLPRKLVVAVASALLVATPTPDLVLLWLTTGHVASFADMSAIAGPLDRPGQAGDGDHELELAGVMAMGINGQEMIANGRAIPGKVLHMFLNRFAENQNVIKIHNHKPTNLLAEDLVHKTLKGGRCVRETEGHYGEFVKPVSGLERSLVLVRMIDFNLVVPRLEIDLVEDLAPTCSIKQIIYVWQWVCILLCDAA
ncbi:hypothetical protein CBR_g25858 [Chara braunii]|uniref:Uncharacterized protein n=1 Tax=Chara braunii TaxID=69332 RepID=A0A388L6K4_CHABU|nr:hypothetical protein CBR_g25858 [Chara braunii]|eukprot:GBG77927.1 hypothetical protein CBR_g25858 [Chara braunii]